MRKNFTLEDAPLATVKNYVVKRLSLRSFAVCELAKELRKKKVGENHIQTLLQEFSQLGYLNDETWLENFISACSRKKLGPHAIAQKLYQKGFPQSQIEPLIAALDPKESLAKLLATKYKNRDLSDYKERQKVIASLCRKGFPLEDILAAL